MPNLSTEKSSEKLGERVRVGGHRPLYSFATVEKFARQDIRPSSGEICRYAGLQCWVGGIGAKRISRILSASNSGYCSRAERRSHYLDANDANWEGGSSQELTATRTVQSGLNTRRGRFPGRCLLEVTINTSRLPQLATVRWSLARAAVEGQDSKQTDIQIQTNCLPMPSTIQCRQPSSAVNYLVPSSTGLIPVLVIVLGCLHIVYHKIILASITRIIPLRRSGVWHQSVK